MRPCDATSERKIIKLQRDNFPADHDKWSILIMGDHVSLHPPGGGTFIQIPAKQFKALAEWYLSDQEALSSPPHRGK